MNHISFRRHTAAAENWDEHGIDESDGEVVDVEVQAPLSAILSIRLDAKRHAKLKNMAKKRGLPITAMAQAILTEALDEP